MQDLVYTSFGGIVPRHTQHQLAKTQASYAHDVKLRNGIIEPWLEPCVQDTVASSVKMIHVRGCHLHTWDKNVQIAETATDWGRFYLTGRHDYPEVVTEDCDGKLTYLRLGCPAPSEAPYCEGEESCERDSDARSYCYTYTNKFGEESAPSPPSNIITVSDGASVTVTGITTPPSGYGINRINIYRTASGFREGNPKKQDLETAFFHVATISSSNTEYTDSKLLSMLGMPLDTEDINNAPTKLSGIVSIDDHIRLAGYYENKIYFSEYTELYNWPVKYELTIDDMITYMDQSKQILFITTGSYPYIINTNTPDDCAQVIKARAPYPDIACIYPHTHLMTIYGLIYVTAKGLALLGADGKVQLLTTPWFDSREWTRLNPDQARLGMYEGSIFFSTDRISFCLSLWGDSFNDVKGGELTTISDNPKDYFRTSTGDLYFLEGTKVKVWDRGTTYRKYYWLSKELTGNTQHRDQQFFPISMKVKSEATKMDLYGDDDNLKLYSRFVSNEEPFRLPRFGRHKYYKVKFTGTKPVEFFSFGTSNFTVNNGS